MPVDDPSKVDAIGIETLTGKVILTIADFYEWEPLEEHLILLQDKINAYLAFLESGEIFENLPEARNRKIRIDLICKHAPSQGAYVFLEHARIAIEKAGAEFIWKTSAH